MNYINEINNIIDTSIQYSHLSRAQKQVLHQDPDVIYNTLWELSQKYPTIPNLIDWSKDIQKYVPNATQHVINDADNDADYLIHSNENIELKLIIANADVIMLREESMGGDWQSPVNATIIITATTFEQIVDVKNQNHFLTHYVNQLELISNDLYHKSLKDISVNETKILLEDLINALYVFFIIDNGKITAFDLKNQAPNYFFNYKSQFTLNHYQLILNQIQTPVTH